MLGYWNDPDKTAEAIDAAGWMHTGDLAVMDDEGYLNIVGRIKDMIIRGGENVYPREIEEFLYGHPDIVDVQVIGVPDVRYGEEIMAWLKVRDGAAARHRGAAPVLPGSYRPLQDAPVRPRHRRVPDDRHRQGAEVQDARGRHRAARAAGRRRRPDGMTAAFPAGFEWGTATAAHQIEGGNWNNDWWLWEHTPVVGMRRAEWRRLRLVAPLGRGRAPVPTSSAWAATASRSSGAASSPRKGSGRVLRSTTTGGWARRCWTAGIDPVVTFHHFTTPRWLAARGGWADGHTVDAFARFCERAARALGPVMRRACTINEPNIVALHGFQTGVFPPGRREPAVRRRVGEHFCEAHRKAVDAIRTGAPDVPVGLTLSMADYQAVDGGEAKRAQIVRSMEDVFLDATEGDDFLGVQVYTRERVGPNGLVGNEDGVPVLPMGYEHWPQALEACLRRAWDYTEGEVPLLVTENGIGTDDDDQRIDYVATALEGVLRCIDDGLDVRGYTYWSLLDNFEWAFGYGPRFGLVDVDRATFTRTPKPSAHWLAGVVKANALPDMVERAVR